MRPHFAPDPVRCGETRWREHFRTQRASGLGISAFCRRENLAPSTFYWWRRFVQRSDTGVVRPPVQWQEVALAPAALPAPVLPCGPLPGPAPAAYALKVGSARGLWVEFPIMPPALVLAEVCGVLQSSTPVPC